MTFTLTHPAVGTIHWGSEHTAWIKTVVARRDRLFKYAPRCLRCRSSQVQSIDRKVFATWKCRHCHHYFMYEPIIPESETLCHI